MNPGFPLQMADRGLVDAHLSLALEANQMGTWEWELATGRVVWSSALEEIHGLGGEHGRFAGTFDAFQRDIHPADRVRMLDSIAQAISGDRQHYVEYRIVRPDGSVRWLETRGRLLHDRDGRPERLVGVCSDITERKEAMLRLELSEAFYAATVMSVAEAVITTDPGGHVTLMNGVAEVLTGWRIDEARGRCFDEVVQPLAEPTSMSHAQTRVTRTVVPEPSHADQEPVPESNGSGAATDCVRPEGRRMVKTLVRRDGSTVVIDESAAPIRDARGEVVGQVVVLRDVTEQRQEDERRGFIAEASALLASSLDFKKTLSAIAQFAVRRVADWCAVYATTDDGSVERLIIAHKDERLADLAARLAMYQPSVAYPTGVIRTGKSVLIRELSEEQLRAGAASNEHFEILRAMDLTSYMVAPLCSSDRIFGAITYMTSGGVRLDERDLDMAEELGVRAGTAMENARLYEQAQRARLAAEASAARSGLIQEMTAALSQAPTPTLVAEVVTSLGAKTIGAASASLFELSSSGDALVLLRSFGHSEVLPEEFRRFSMDSDVPIVDAVRTGCPVFFESFDEFLAHHPQLVRRLSPFASWAALPLEVEGRRLGALGMSFATRRHFDAAERDFMVTMSRLCAEALERANLYEAAQKARADAESARRTRENLLTIVSHDLRNPLGAIATTATVLAKADPTREPAARIKRAGANILRAAQRMDRLIVDLLDLAKIESGRFVFRIQTHDAASLVRDSVEILAPVASGKGLSLLADVRAVELRIFCDRERIMQVLSNLIGNALKFTEEGGTISVSVREVDGQARYAVRDTGCGIAADQLPHIFDRYWQAKSARDGIGLGLSIAKGIVEAHGGRIWVETQMGQGTTFLFTVPTQGKGGAGPIEAGAVDI